jgi:hypothetical protein
VPEKDEKGRFLTGNIGGGRPKGSRNKLGEAFTQALFEHFQAEGAGVIKRVAEEHPDTYVRVIASLLPKELKVEQSPVEALSDDELASLIHSVRAAASATLSPRGRAGEASGPH